MLKSIISSSNAEGFIAQSNTFLRNLISRMGNLKADSFMMQLVTFGICSQPCICDSETLDAFKSLFNSECSELERYETIQILVENWILLLKAASKGGTGLNFEKTTKSISRTIEEKLAISDKRTTEELNPLLTIAQDLCIKSGEKSEVLEAILHK